MKEKWLPVKGFEELYLVSTAGRVKSLAKRAMLKPKTSNTGGYPSVNLCRQGRCDTCKVHRLVATAFVPNPENKRCVNHKDSNRKNNSVDNLEWCTHQENTLHAYRLGRIKNPPRYTGETHPSAKLKEDDVIKIIARLANGESCLTLSREYLVTEPAIRFIKKGRTWKLIPRSSTESEVQNASSS